MDLLHLNFRRRIAGLVWAQRLFWLPAVAVFFVWKTGFAFWLTVVFSLLLAGALKSRATSLRRQFVREAAFPRFLSAKICAAHPGLAERDAELVLRGLRQFFMAHLRSNRKFVAMPSKLVDTAWHEFILHTQGYQRWCQAAFGGLLHHSPAEVLGADARRNDGLRRSWYWACKEESIDPRKPTRLPLLFALDVKFGVPGGFSYVPDCKGQPITGHDGAMAQCGSDFGTSDGGSSGDAGGFGGSEASSSGEGGGDGGSGDSGSGCGGGCGGGGGGGD